MTGSGDVAPFEPIVDPLHVTFFGTLFGLIALIALGALFVTAEYRRGMIRTTVTASPRRGRILVAKALVIGVLAFVSGLIGAAIALPIAAHKLVRQRVDSRRSGRSCRSPAASAFGWYSARRRSRLSRRSSAWRPVPIFRRSTGAIMATTGVVVVPVILGVVLPLTPATWLLRITPAAAFSLQAGVPRYPRSATSARPTTRASRCRRGLASPCCVPGPLVALAGAIYLLRRRDV